MLVQEEVKGVTHMAEAGLGRAQTHLKAVAEEVQADLQLEGALNPHKSDEAHMRLLMHNLANKGPSVRFATRGATVPLYAGIGLI